MSEDPDDRAQRAEENQPPAEEPQDEQPPAGQPPEEQPPAGQQRGGQQPSTQRQGGQPPAGQPQGGQPRDRRPPVGQQPQGGNMDRLQEWVVYVTALFGIAGAGLGILWILVDAIDEPIFEVDSFSGGGGGALSGLAPLILLVVITLVAVFVGAWLGRHLDTPDQETFKIAGASLATGAAAFFALSSLLISVGFDNVSLNIGGLLINVILTAALAAGIAVGGVFVTRNQAPADL